MTFTSSLPEAGTFVMSGSYELEKLLFDL